MSTRHCPTQNHSKDHLQLFLLYAAAPLRRCRMTRPQPARGYNPQLQDNPDPSGRGGGRRGGDPDSSEAAKRGGGLETFGSVQLSLCDGEKKSSFDLTRDFRETEPRSFVTQQTPQTPSPSTDTDHEARRRSSPGDGAITK